MNSEVKEAMNESWTAVAERLEQNIDRLLEENRRLRADIAALIEAATAAYDLFVAAAMDGDKWIEEKLGAALKPFADEQPAAKE